MSRRKHGGFTLIELLIVIIVIAILSVAMMLSGDEVQSTAKATQIINDLNAWKRAALSYWADNQDKVLEAGFDFGEKRSEVMRYLNVNKDFLDDISSKAKKAGRCDTFQSRDGAWYIWYDMQWGSGWFTNGEARGVCAKLAGRAKSAGLLSNQGYSKEDLKKRRTSAQIDAKLYGVALNESKTRAHVLMRVR